MDEVHTIPHPHDPLLEGVFADPELAAELLGTNSAP